jgi:Transposase DDE domain
MHPNPRLRAQQQRRVQHRANQCDAYTFFNLLTGPALLDRVESLLPEHRERLFPPTETLSMFLSQALHNDHSCQRAVNDASVKRLIGGLPACSTHTGGYCRARARLPLSMLSRLTQHTGQAMTAQAPNAWHWRGHPVRLVDGTTLAMPDTVANQTVYPQPRSQEPGLGFPLARLVGLICLGSGAVLDAALGGYRGKGNDEQTLLRTLLDTLKAGDLLLGDAYYASFFLFCALRERGVEAVFEQQGARRRSTDFRRGARLGARDHLIELRKPKRKPDWMADAQYALAPETLTVRERATGGKILVTTLLCPKRTPKADLKALYRERWHVELDFRHIKTTLGMESLSCKTPSMAQKEIWIYLLAYNLIRLMMAQAAVLSACRPRELSFKHALQLWIAWDHYGNGTHRDGQRHALFILIAQQRVGNRPGRIEPRAIQRRPKPFPLLMEARSMAREKVRMHGHPRKIK